jgi:hypothetical protein
MIEFLKKNIENTRGRQEWTYRNFDLLQKFFGKGNDGLGLDCCPNDTECEFLWDFVAYIPHRGNLLIAESEWDNTEWENKFPELEKDFDKLLYSRSPIKLFMCRIDNPEQAERIRARLQTNIEESCSYYSSGEAFIIYCVWWAEKNGENRDIAYMVQIDGEPNYQPIGGSRFEIATE